jgi:hypothetical protein
MQARTFHAIAANALSGVHALLFRATRRLPLLAPHSAVVIQSPAAEPRPA